MSHFETNKKVRRAKIESWRWKRCHTNWDNKVNCLNSIVVTAMDFSHNLRLPTLGDHQASIEKSNMCVLKLFFSIFLFLFRWKCRCVCVGVKLNIKAPCMCVNSNLKTRTCGCMCVWSRFRKKPYRCLFQEHVYAKVFLGGSILYFFPFFSSRIKSKLNMWVSYLPINKGCNGGYNF